MQHLRTTPILQNTQLQQLQWQCAVANNLPADEFGKQVKAGKTDAFLNSKQRFLGIQLGIYNNYLFY